MPIDDITPSVVRTWWAWMPADKPTVRARCYALLKAVLNTAVADEVIDATRAVSAGRPTLAAGSGDPAGDHRGARGHRRGDARAASRARAARAPGARCAAARCSSCAAGTSTSRQGPCGSSARCPGSAASRSSARRSRRLARGWSPSRRTSFLRSPTTSSTFTASGCRRSPLPGRQRRLEPPAVDAVQVLAAGAGGGGSTGPSPPRPAPHRRDDGRDGRAQRLADLQQRLGHSSVNAALRYQHASRGRDQEIAAALSAMARGSGA